MNKLNFKWFVTEKEVSIARLVIKKKKTLLTFFRNKRLMILDIFKIAISPRFFFFLTHSMPRDSDTHSELSVPSHLKFSP